MKTGDVDIDLFSDHDKMDTQPDETGGTIILNPGGVGGGGEELLGNQSKKRHLEERVLRRRSSQNMLKGCIKCYLKSHSKSQKHSISMISNSEMVKCTTKARAFL